MFHQARNIVLALALAAASSRTSSAFTVPSKNHVVFHNKNVLVNEVNNKYRTSSSPMSMMSDSSAPDSNKNVVVISPPGGLGEIAAVSAAKAGGSVRWFVVSSGRQDSQSKKKFSLSEETLSTISKAGGSFDFAGADAPSLLLSSDQVGSALAAVGKWCGSSDAVICTMDGVVEETAITGVKRDREVMTKEMEDLQKLKDALKVATREAAALSASNGVRVALQPLSEVAEEQKAAGEEEKGGKSLLKGLLGGAGVDVPATLAKALESSSSGATVTVLRHGDLFGVPESSGEASPFMGGPRRDPILRDEITLRSIRLDPTLSAYGTTLKGDTKRSSRLSLGDAAALMVLKSVPTSNGLDVVLSSFPGMDILSAEDWEAEFVRVQDVISTSGGAAGAELFETSFASIPNKARLADWIATKWAPAILRTYDIAGIRVGARPVYAARVGDSSTEIVWQKLVDFQSVTVGKMIIDVTDDNSIKAKRGAGDASAGFGSISLKPLAGEDILISRLADAASQAVEKGLATKATVAKKERAVAKKEVAAPKVASTVASSGTVETAKPSRESGPRTAGARRSAERTRGKRRKKVTPTPMEGAETGSSETWQ